MSEGKKGGAFMIRTRKFMQNKLLGRKQMLLDVSHFGRASVPRTELKEKLVKMFKVKDANCIVLFGYKMAFGGGKTTVFCLIYDNLAALKKVEPKHRMIRQGLAEKKETSAKQKKERKVRVAGARRALRARCSLAAARHHRTAPRRSGVWTRPRRYAAQRPLCFRFSRSHDRRSRWRARVQ